MHKLINILAVIIGVASALLALAGCVVCVAILIGLFKGDTTVLTHSWGWLGIAFSASAVVIGSVIASRALLHLRHPDAGTVRDMIGTAIFLIVMMGVLPLGIRLHAPGALLLAAPIALYIFHRYLVRRVTAQVFPPDVTSPQT